MTESTNGRGMIFCEFRKPARPKEILGGTYMIIPPRLGDVVSLSDGDGMRDEGFYVNQVNWNIDLTGTKAQTATVWVDDPYERLRDTQDRKPNKEQK